MASELGLECQVCGFVGLDDGSDGFFYCQRCGSQADGIRDTAVDNDDMILTKENVVGLVQRRVPAVKNEPLTQSQPASQFWEDLWTQVDDVKVGDGVGPTEPADFGSGPRTLEYHDYYKELRIRYVMGVQIMIQLQVKALIETFDVCPIIVDLFEPIWLRFLASTKVFTDGWADRAIAESESQLQGETEIVGPRPRHKNEPHNLLGKRNVMIWYRSVSKTIPLCYSLAFSFLACHLAREAILPTDIINWVLEGKLPYFAAFAEIDKQMGPPTNACPLKSSLMFRPIQSISAQKLESLAGSIAHSIGLELPPVNFYAIASRYLTQLSLPVETILPHACRIYEWSMPPELWLSANESRLPTRAYVLSLLIVSIRILYNIHGFGKWEMSLSCTTENKDGKKSKGMDIAVDEEMADADNVAEMSDTSSSQSDNDDSAAEHSDKKVAPNLDATDILLVLNSKYSELIDTSDHSKDLEIYVKYCKDVVFAGAELSFEYHEEAQIIEDFWNFYQQNEDNEPPEAYSPSSSSQLKRSPDCAQTGTNETKKPKTDDAKVTLDPNESHKERAIRQMISNMEENHFTYIPPRTKVKRHDYLHYTRKKGNGAYAYAAHADYYILLRSCAQVARLDVRIMHAAVQAFERRLAWLEKNIEHFLTHQKPYESCQFCDADDEPTQDVLNDEYMDFSKLNL